MSRIKSHSSKTEVLVRKIIYQMGYRYRIQRKDLPGRPDISIKKYKIAIFINGCFWHGHEGCKRSSRPKSNYVFWSKKIESNIKRDNEIFCLLKSMGWKVLIVWQCQTKNREQLNRMLKTFMEAQ